MTLPYFRQIPNLEYVNRTSSKLSQYITVKNLFKRCKIREDIFKNVTFFEKYKIIGDERPDNVANKYYDDATLDWVVLLSNNIINIQTEWPIAQPILDKVLLEKYGSYQSLYSVGYVDGTFYPPHHCETVEIRNSDDIIILPKGIQVPYKIEQTISSSGTEVVDIAVPDFNFAYFDYELNQEVIVTNTNAATFITNYDYEIKSEDEKRNIFLLKPQYLSVIFDDIEDIMQYKKGGTQYVSTTLKRGDNIKLYS